MPALNFKAQFADDVAAGRKRQTIRRRRKRPIKVGDPLYLYTGMRTKHSRMLRPHPEPCTEVVPIEIWEKHIVLDGRSLDFDEQLEIARADGFRTLDEFYAFFERQYNVRVFEGVLLKW